jgi:hypothetical protein
MCFHCTVYLVLAVTHSILVKTIDIYSVFLLPHLGLYSPIVHFAIGCEMSELKPDGPENHWQAIAPQHNLDCKFQRLLYTYIYAIM